MAVFGQGINPALGRIDYSPYAQGAAIGAQGIAQGISGFSQSVSKGIQDFLKKEEEKKLEQEGIEFIKAQFPGVDDKAARAGYKTVGPAAFVRFKQEQDQLRKQEQAASYAAMLSQGGGRVPAPISNQALAQFSPQARVAGEAAFLATEQARANVAKTKAEEAALRTPKASLGYDTFEAANKELNRLSKAGAFGEDTIGTVKFDNGRFVIESSVKPPRQVPDLEAAERIRLSGKLMDADIANGEQARRLLPQTNRMIQSLKSGMKTGKFEAAKTELTSYAKSFGFKVDEEALAEKEQFQAYATQQILGFFQQTKGGVSNKENELFGLMGPGYTRSERANELLLEVIQERQKLDAAIGDNALRAIEEGWSQAKTAAERRKLIEAYDAKLPDPAKLGVTPISGEMPVLPQSPSGGLSPSTRALIPSR